MIQNLSQTKAKVLIVDDDITITTVMENYLYVKNLDVMSVNSVYDAIEILKKQNYMKIIFPLL